LSSKNAFSHQNAFLKRRSKARRLMPNFAVVEALLIGWPRNLKERKDTRVYGRIQPRRCGHAWRTPLKDIRRLGKVEAGLFRKLFKLTIDDTHMEKQLVRLWKRKTKDESHEGEWLPV
jgi:hypothetical protein